MLEDGDPDLNAGLVDDYVQQRFLLDGNMRNAIHMMEGRVGEAIVKTR